MTELQTLFSQRHLDTAVDKTKPVIPFLMSNVFKNKTPVSSEIIDFEQINGSPDLAGFVNDDALEPRIVGKGNKAVYQLKVPRVWEQKVFTAQELRDVNGYANITNPQDRAQAVAEYLRREVASLQSRFIRFHEYLAAELLQTGKVTYTDSQEGVSVKIDYGFVTNKQKITLTAGAKWDADPDPDIIAQIESWKKIVKGANLLVLGSDAATEFRANAEVKKILDQNNIQVGKIDLTKPADEAVEVIADNFMGLKVVEYHGTYYNGSVDANYVNPKNAILVNTNKDFKHYYAPIYRIHQTKGLDVIMKEYYLKANTNTQLTRLAWEMENKPLLGIKDKEGVLTVTTH